MKTIICGGRDYVLTFADRVWLDELRFGPCPISVIADGGATGADAGGREYAEDRGITVVPFPAKWDDIDAPGAVIRTRRDGKKYNVLAGFWRNEDMAKWAEACIAFPGGTGTADMIKRAKAHGLPVYERAR